MQKKGKYKNIIKKRNFHLTWKYFFLFSILLITCFIYFNSLSNGFVSWDDPEMIINNHQVTEKLSVKSIFNIFVPSNSINEFQPLTALFYHLTYSFFGLQPSVFHLISLLLHLLSVVLLFSFIEIVLKKSNIALIVAALFALHPLNVESVAWISTLNYALFMPFFLWALIFYTKYILNKMHKKYLCLSLFFFLFSLLSKSTAVVFPIVLFSIDFFYRRSVNLVLFVEKLPFFILSLITGIIALKLRAEVLTSITVETYSVIDRIIFAFYTLSMYFIKIIFPLNLSILYEYPQKIASFFPIEYYLLPVLILFVLVILFLTLNNERRFILFCLFFFITNLLVVIHIIPFYHIGIIADRYVYVAAIAVFILLTHLGLKYLETYPNHKKYIHVVLVLYFAVISIISFNRVKVWENDVVLFSDLIKKNPDAAIAYNNRANAKSQQGNYFEALEDLDKAIDLKPDYVEAFYNRGVVKNKMGNYKGAIKDCNKVIEIKPDYAKAYYNRANIKIKMGDTNNIIEDYNKAIEINPNYADAFNNRGLFYSKQNNLDKAIEDFNKTIKIQPSHAEAYYNRGNNYGKIGNFDKAIQDLDKAIKVNPNYFEAYCDRGVAYSLLNNYDAALGDINKAIALNNNYVRAYYNLGIVYLNMNYLTEACKNFQIAKQKGSPEAQNMFNIYCK